MEVAIERLNRKMVSSDRHVESSLSSLSSLMIIIPPDLPPVLMIRHTLYGTSVSRAMYLFLSQAMLLLQNGAPVRGLVVEVACSVGDVQVSLPAEAIIVNHMIMASLSPSPSITTINNNRKSSCSKQQSESMIIIVAWSVGPPAVSPVLS